MKGKGQLVTYICTPVSSVTENNDSHNAFLQRQHSAGLPLARSRSIMAMNFHQFLNSEETKANAMTLKFNSNSAAKLQIIPEESELLGKTQHVGTRMSINREKLFENSKMNLYTVKYFTNNISLNFVVFVF